MYIHTHIYVYIIYELYSFTTWIDAGWSDRIIATTERPAGAVTTSESHNNAGHATRGVAICGYGPGAPRERITYGGYQCIKYCGLS